MCGAGEEEEEVEEKLRHSLPGAAKSGVTRVPYKPTQGEGLTKL